MKKIAICSSALLALSFSVFASMSMAQDAGPLRYPLPKGGEAYADIDGQHLMQYVKEQTKIARDYRDNGHPQYWGRITGTAADEASAQWLMAKYKQIGLTDVRAQNVNMFLPQWAPKGWTVTLTGGGKSQKLVSAHPAYGSPGTEGGKEVDLEVVYVGAGNEADFAGKDVRGKAVVAIIGPLLHNIGLPDVRKRAMDKGAAAILGYELRGGNHTMQAYPPDTKIPAIHLGEEDGNAIRAMVESGAAPHLKISFDSQFESGQKTSLVWGTLPGATDETIYFFAHRDGWFEAAGDNATGVSSMLGIAEHYAKIPQAQRKRTMIFIGTDGHHNGQAYGMAWLGANQARLFAKTALMINGEHPSEMATHPGGGGGTSNSTIANEWYAGGETRPNLTKIALDAFHEFGVPLWTKQTLGGAGGDMGNLRAYVPGVAVEANDFLKMHYEDDNDDNVSWTGLEAVTRAYAKIIDEVNKLPLSDLQRPVETAAARKSFVPDSCVAWFKDSSAACKP